MAYIDGFEHDLFISYAHVDNLAATGKLPWVEEFHKRLDIALAQRIGRMGMVKIWRDKKLEGDHLFDQTISEGLEKAALFVALTSNGYLASDYCQQELKAFHKKADAASFGLQIGDRSRIYVALLNNIPPTRWPEEYGRITGHPFHDAEDDDAFGLPSDLTEKPFDKQLRALADSLYRMLLAFKEAATSGHPSTQQETTEDAEEGPTVFFADVTDSLRPRRKRVINELERKGIHVVTGMPPPYDATTHEARVKAVLQNADLSVHLLDEFAGREIDGEAGTTYPRKQVDLALSLDAAPLIWIPKGIGPEQVADEQQEHRDFLDRLENGVRDQGAFDFVRGTSAELAPQIIEKLKQRQASAEADAVTQAVLVDTHLKDQLFAFELSRFLLENKIQPYINPQEDDPTKNTDLLEARLNEVSMLMILYGSVNENWVRQRLGAALQLKMVNNLPIQSFCIVSVPPEKKVKAIDFNFGMDWIWLVDNSGSTTLDPAALAPVLQSLRRGGAA